MIPTVITYSIFILTTDIIVYIYIYICIFAYVYIYVLIFIYIYIYIYTCRFPVKKGLQKAKHDDMVLCG